MISACAKVKEGGSGHLSFRPNLHLLGPASPPLLGELDLLAESGEHVLAKIRRRVADRFRPVREDALAHFRPDEVHDLCPQPREYRDGKFCRRREVVLAGNLEPRQRFRHCWPDRQCRKVPGCGDHEPAPLCLIASSMGGLFANKIEVVLTAYQIGERRPRTLCERARSACRHQNVEFTRARSVSHGWALCRFGLCCSLCSVG